MRSELSGVRESPSGSYHENLYTYFYPRGRILGSMSTTFSAVHLVLPLNPRGNNFALSFRIASK